MYLLARRESGCFGSGGVVGLDRSPANLPAKTKEAGLLGMPLLGPLIGGRANSVSILAIPVWLRAVDSVCAAPSSLLVLQYHDGFLLNRNSWPGGLACARSAQRRRHTEGNCYS